MDTQPYSEHQIPLLDDTEDLTLNCETVEHYCARWLSIAEAMADEN